LQLFEEPVGSIFTDGPAVIVKVEQRSEPLRSMFDTRGVSWRKFGVIIYQAKGKASPVQKGGEWMMPETAHETRFLKVPHFGEGCEVPENAGRLLGHYEEDGRRWWVFLEKLGSASASAPPAPAERRKSAPQSPSAPRAPASSTGAPPSKQPTSPPGQRPGSNAGRGQP
jgi:hypothetical protein